MITSTSIAALAFMLMPVLQDPEGTVAGRVLDVAGKPLASAKVLFLHRSIPSSLDSPAVRRKAVTDTKGMFRVRLPVGRTFSAWASWDKGATGIVEAVSAGSFLTLRQDPGLRPQRIVVTGADKWAELGPLSFRVVVGTENLDLLPVTRSGNELVLPPLPRMPYRAIEVLAKDGRLLWTDRAKVAVGEKSKTLALPPLTEVKVLVLDKDGKPVAGAEVRRHIRNYWYTRSASVPFGSRFRSLWPIAGVTDREGKLSLRVPLPAQNQRRRLHFMARRKGYRASLSGWYQGKRYRNSVKDRVEAKQGEANSLTFDLEKVATSTGRFQVADVAYAGPVSLRWRVTICGGLGMPFHEAVLTSATGRFDYPQPPQGSDLEQAWVFLPQAIRQKVRKELGAAPAAAYELANPKSILTRDGADEPFLRENSQAVRVMNADGRPAERALVIAARVSHEQARFQSGTFVRTDRAGLALVPRTQTDQVLFAATSRDWIALRLPPGEDKKLLSLNLQPRPTVQGQVIDDNKAAVAGVYVGNAPIRGSNELQTDRVLKVLPAQSVAYLLKLMGPVSTDRNGRFRLPLLPVEVAMRVGVTTGGFSPVPGTVSDAFSCEPGEKRPALILKYPVDR